MKLKSNRNILKISLKLEKKLNNNKLNRIKHMKRIVIVTLKNKISKENPLIRNKN